MLDLGPELFTCLKLIRAKLKRIVAKQVAAGERAYGSQLSIRFQQVGYPHEMVLFISPTREARLLYKHV